MTCFGGRGLTWTSCVYFVSTRFFYIHFLNQVTVKPYMLLWKLNIKEAFFFNSSQTEAKGIDSSFFCQPQWIMGGMRRQGSAGRSRSAPGEGALRFSGELHPAGGAVPLRHNYHAGRAGQEEVRRAREPGAGEERRCVKTHWSFFFFFLG